MIATRREQYSQRMFRLWITDWFEQIYMVLLTSVPETLFSQVNFPLFSPLKPLATAVLGGFSDFKPFQLASIFQVP